MTVLLGPERPARARAGGEDVAVAAWEIHRLVTIVPAHPIVLGAAVARYYLAYLALSAGLADVPAVNDDPVTCTGVHGEPPRSRSALSPVVIPRPRAATEGVGPGPTVSRRGALELG